MKNDANVVLIGKGKIDGDFEDNLTKSRRLSRTAEQGTHLMRGGDK